MVRVRFGRGWMGMAALCGVAVASGCTTSAAQIQYRLHLGHRVAPDVSTNDDVAIAFGLMLDEQTDRAIATVPPD